MTTSILDMPFSKAMEVMKEWVKEVHDGQLKLDDPLNCPVQKWIEHKTGQGVAKRYQQASPLALCAVRMCARSVSTTNASP